MDAADSTARLVVVAVFAAVQLLATGLCLARRTSSPAGALRLSAAIPFGVYGGTAVQASFQPRYDARGPVSPRDPVALSRNMHGVVGILLIAWAVAGLILVERSKGRSWPHALRWRKRRFASFHFYLALGDTCHCACVLAALAYSSQSTPWQLGRCSEYAIDSSWPVSQAGREAECRRMLTVQAMAVPVLLVLAAQFTLAVPLIALPSPLRAQLFLATRALRLRLRTATPGDAWRNQDETPLGSSATEKKASLEALFRSDSVLVSLANHLHADDVYNAASTSKSMRQAVLLGPPPHGREQRLDMVCESSCMSGSAKSQCWACAKVICDGCKVERSGLTSPQTQAHVSYCFALCTKCYLLRSAARPAAFTASWNPNDLSVQHIPYCKHPIWKIASVHLCPSCARLGDEHVLRVRERRDEVSLRLTLARRIRCSRCEKALPRGRRRWWICEGKHECHWAGHEPA